MSHSPEFWNHIFKVKKPVGILKAGLKRLGISAEIETNMLNLDLGVFFNSEEDMNLYRLVGKVKETSRIKFYVK